MNIEEWKKLSNNDKSKYRKNLIQGGSSYCAGELCVGKIKPLSAFLLAGNICKECNVYRKKLKKETYTEAHIREKFKLKMNKVCEMCGEDNIEFLEFDHINPKDKEKSIAACSSVDEVLKEAQKTRLLCRTCHRLHTKSQTSKLRKTANDYLYSKEENEKIINGKPCKGILCNNKIRNLNCFKSGNTCKKCYNYNLYLKREENRNFVDNEKLRIGECLKCKKKITPETICCFYFDHRDPSTKLCNVSQLRTVLVPIQSIINEMNKCDLLCARCHFNRTQKQFNYTTIEKILSDKPVLKKTKVKKLEVKRNQVDKDDKGSVLCPKCKINYKDKKGNFCLTCSHKKLRTVERPSLEILKNDVKELGYCGTGKKYGVTDNAIRKWIKCYEKYGY